MKRLIKWLLDYVDRCMEGRNGLDGLSAMYLCVCAVLVSCAFNMVSGTIKTLTCIGAVALGIYALYRCFSKDTEKCQQQWKDFELGLEEIEYKISLRTEVWKIKRSYRNIRCKKCGYRFRVPRVREKTTAICPNCENIITRRI